MNGLINILGSDQLLRSDLSSVSFNLQRQSNDLVERERIIAPAHRESVTEDLKIKNKIHRPPVVAKGKHKRTLTRKTTSIGPLQLATPSVPSSPRRKIRKHRVMSPMASPQFDLKQLPYSENQTPLHNNQSVEFKNDPEVNPTTNPLGFLPTDLFQFDTSSIPKKRPLSQNNSNAKNNPVDREKLQYLAELLQEREENIPPNRLRVKMKKPKSNENGNTMKETNEGKENSLPTKKEVKTKVIDPQPQLKPKHVDQEELKRLHAYMKQKKLLKKEKLLKEQEEEERKRRLVCSTVINDRFMND
ncbi:hypothetical protein BC833DRAFT_267610 [Globomyces pollinis-pini]|nr:hypothetical protein BC833DRAFT_267610 [Globomyces pollinis-pini]